MNLIDRYINHVGKHLPGKSREDLKREIRSLVEDTLEDRSKELGRPVDEAMTVDVLKEFGRPEKMASSYLPERYLIGPRLFPVFWLVTRIVASVLLGIMLIKLFFDVSHADANISQLIMQTLGFGQGIISALGNIVIVFAIIQWVSPDISLDDEKEKDWNPLDMENIEDEDEVGLVEHTIGITFTAAALILFNFYPELFGFGFFSGDKWAYLPALSQAFFSYLPWLNLIWGSEIVLDLFLIRQGRWQPLTRLFSIGIKAITVGLAGIMLTGSSLISLDPQELAKADIGFTLENANMLISLLEQGIKGALILIIVLGSFEIAKRIYKLLSAKTGK